MRVEAIEPERLSEIAAMILNFARDHLDKAIEIE
jgi:hypothetical protein